MLDSSSLSEPNKARKQIESGQYRKEAATILSMISNEASMLADIYQTQKQMAKAFGSTALLDDECIRPLLVQLVGPEVSQILANDFKLDEVLS